MINKIKKGKTTHVRPVVAAVTGAVIGAGVAIAGAAVMKDEKNREKAKKALNSVKGKAAEYIEDLQKQTQDQKAKAEDKLAESKKLLENTVSNGKK